MARPPASIRRFLVDENLPRELAGRLREAGYDADHVYSVGLRGALDEQIFRYAQEHGQVILTCDVGFGNVLHYAPPHAGIVVARLPDTVTTSRRLQIVVGGLSLLTGERLEDAVATIEVGRVRIHR